MILSPEELKELVFPELAEIVKQLKRIADSLEAVVNDECLQVKTELIQ